MALSFVSSESPIESFDELGRELGVDLLVKRDDLLPFPLAGNKVRKLMAEASEAGWVTGDVLISNGGVDSNHCRTLALMAARMGARAHLVLHSEGGRRDDAPLRLLATMGATYDVVASENIASTIVARRAEFEARNKSVRVIPGGAHTPAGVRAYLSAGSAALKAVRPDHLVVASGTGATHAGLHVAAQNGPRPTVVTGISVARQADRGRKAVMEAVGWVEPSAAATVRFDARFIDGGYANASDATWEVVEWAWKRGLPVDATYTGKALRGVVEMVREGSIQQGEQVLFWHTGGLMNHLVSL